MIVTRQMTVEERTEVKNETRFELRHANGLKNHDDQMTLVIVDAGAPEDVPTWKVGQLVAVTFEDA